MGGGGGSPRRPGVLPRHTVWEPRCRPVLRLLFLLLQLMTLLGHTYFKKVTVDPALASVSSFALLNCWSERAVILSAGIWDPTLLWVSQGFVLKLISPGNGFQSSLFLTSSV